MEPVDLDDSDEQILAILSEDARTSNEAIAEQVGISIAAVEDRIERLRDEGVITKFTTMLDPEELGYISIGFGFSVEPNKVDEVVEALSEYENVYKLWIASGQHNIIAHAEFENITEYQEFASDNIHNHDGIVDSQSSIASKLVVNEGDVVIDDERP